MSSEAYHPISYVSKVFKKPTDFQNDNQFTSMNSIFFSKLKTTSTAQPDYERIQQQTKKQNRNQINSICFGVENKYNQDDFISQNRRDYNSINYTIPKPIFTSAELLKQKQSQKLALGSISIGEESKCITENHQQYRTYDINEIKKKNDGSVYKNQSDSNLRKHHHEFDTFGLNKNQTNISNYNLNYINKINNNNNSQSNPFINNKMIEKQNNKDNILLGYDNNYKNINNMKTEAMFAYEPKTCQTISNSQIMNNIRYRQPLVLGTDSQTYQTSNQTFLTPQIIDHSSLIYSSSDHINSKKQTNFRLGGDNIFSDYNKNTDTQERQKEFLNEYKYNQQIYKRLLNQNRFDSTVLGEDKNNFATISKSELPFHPSQNYSQNNRQNSDLLQSIERKGMLGADYNLDHYKSEKQEQFKLYQGSKPNKLNPLREQCLRSSSVKFQEVNIPEFVSINKQTFVSPRLYPIKEDTIFERNLQNSIKKEINSGHIFGENKDKWVTTNQDMLLPYKGNSPNTLGNKLQDLKMSHFEIK